jgi:SNF2 family DNA or RNA helicase
MISLILSNRIDIQPKFDSVSKKWITKSTLVVCPVTLVEQWKKEIEKFTSPPLKVYVYLGGRRIRDPIKLVGFDVILTTYNTLSVEYTSMTNGGGRPTNKQPPA